MLPISVEEIGDTAFYGCKNLDTIYFTGTEKDWMSTEIGDYNDPLNKAVKICNYEGNDLPEEEESQVSNPISAQTSSTPDSDPVAETIVTNEKPDVSDGSFVDGGTDGSITWEFYSNGLLLLSGTGDIPDDGAWRSHRSSISAIVIEEGISEIGENAFRSYESLNSIYIPNTVTEIGDRAFYYCSSLENITIPGSVETMGEFVFYGNALKEVAFEEGVTVG